MITLGLIDEPVIWQSGDIFYIRELDGFGMIIYINDISSEEIQATVLYNGLVKTFTGLILSIAEKVNV